MLFLNPGLHNEMLQMENYLKMNVLSSWIFFSDEDVVIAQYDFQPASENDLQFKKGDRLRIIKEWVNNIDTKYEYGLHI